MTKSSTHVKRGIYPGTFDPMTTGHLDVIVRASTHVVDELVVAVASNVKKAPMFTLEQRIAMVQDEIASLPDPLPKKIRVEGFDDLLIHFVEKQKATCIIRGLRAVSDFEFEFQMAGMNLRMNPVIETIFLMATDKHQFVSSSFIKEIVLLGGDVRPFVPKAVWHRMQQILAKEISQKNKNNP